MNVSRITLAAGTAGLALVALTACGGGSPSTASGTTTTVPSGAASQFGGGQLGGGQLGGGEGFPGAFGKIAAIQGKTLQVQGTDGQTAVTYTASTDFTAEVSAKLSAVKVGGCVTVTPTEDSSSDDSTTVAAASVRITAATNGGCQGGFGGSGDNRFAGGPGGVPSGVPTDRPTQLGSGAPGGFTRMRGAFGQVTAVSATGFTVESTLPSQDGSADTQTVTVTVSADTTYTTTATATASSLKVGKCVSATGKSDDTGAVRATTIRISNPTDGECAGGGFATFRSGNGA